MIRTDDILFSSDFQVVGAHCIPAHELSTLTNYRRAYFSFYSGGKSCYLSHFPSTLCTKLTGPGNSGYLYLMNGVNRSMKEFQMCYALHFYKYQPSFLLAWIELENVSQENLILKNSWSVFSSYNFSPFTVLYIISLLSVSTHLGNKFREHTGLLSEGLTKRSLPLIPERRCFIGN